MNKFELFVAAQLAQCALLVVLSVLSQQASDVDSIPGSVNGSLCFRADMVLWHSEDSNMVYSLHLDVLRLGVSWRYIEYFKAPNKWVTVLPHKKYTTDYWTTYNTYSVTNCISKMLQMYEIIGSADFQKGKG